MIIDWRRKVAEHSHRPFDAEFPVGDTFEFCTSFRFQVGVALCWGKVKQNERDLFWDLEAVKQISKSVWGARFSRSNCLYISAVGDLAGFAPGGYFAA